MPLVHVEGYACAEGGVHDGTHLLAPHLDGLGVGRLRRKGRGDLHVTVVVETPTGLDDRQRQLLAELASLRGEDDVAPPRDESVMGKLKERFSGR